MAIGHVRLMVGFMALLSFAALGFSQSVVSSSHPTDLATFEKSLERSRLLRQALESDSELRASIVGWSAPLPDDLSSLRFVVQSRAVRKGGVTWVEGLYPPRLSNVNGTEPEDASSLGRAQEHLRNGRLLVYVPGGAGEGWLFVRDQRPGTTARVEVSGVDLALPLLGYHTLVDRRPTDVVLTDARSRLTLSRVEMGGRSCLLIDASTPWGRRRVWIDTDRPELVVRVEAETLWNELTDQTDLELWMGMFELPDGTLAAFESPRDGLEHGWHDGALRPRVPVEALAEIDRRMKAPIVSGSGPGGWGWMSAVAGVSIVIVGGVVDVRWRGSHRGGSNAS